MQGDEHLSPSDAGQVSWSFGFISNPGSRGLPGYGEVPVRNVSCGTGGLIMTYEDCRTVSLSVRESIRRAPGLHPQAILQVPDLKLYETGTPSNGDSLFQHGCVKWCHNEHGDMLVVGIPWGFRGMNPLL